jgi:trehalose 6-phosphate synthase
MDYLPVHLINQSVNISLLVALYHFCKICVVSSIRDGMNLISYEYLSCQTVQKGQLILSEFAGSAQSLNGLF